MWTLIISLVLVLGIVFYRLDENRVNSSTKKESEIPELGVGEILHDVGAGIVLAFYKTFRWMRNAAHKHLPEQVKMKAKAEAQKKVNL